ADEVGTGVVVRGTNENGRSRSLVIREVDIGGGTHAAPHSCAETQHSAERRTPSRIVAPRSNIRRTSALSLAIPRSYKNLRSAAPDLLERAKEILAEDAAHLVVGVAALLQRGGDIRSVEEEITETGRPRPGWTRVVTRVVT